VRNVLRFSEEEKLDQVIAHHLSTIVVLEEEWLALEA